MKISVKTKGKVLKISSGVRIKSGLLRPFTYSITNPDPTASYVFFRQEISVYMTNRYEIVYRHLLTPLIQGIISHKNALEFGEYTRLKNMIYMFFRPDECFMFEIKLNEEKINDFITIYIELLRTFSSYALSVEIEEDLLVLFDLMNNINTIGFFMKKISYFKDLVPIIDLAGSTMNQEQINEWKNNYLNERVKTMARYNMEEKWID